MAALNGPPLCFLVIFMKMSSIAHRFPNLGLILFITALCFAFSLLTERFATALNLENLLVGYSFIALIAIGQSFPIMVRGIDLSVGSILALAGMVLFDCILIFELPGSVAVILAVLTGTVAGAINGLIIVFFNLQPFVATLATLAAYRGLVYAISGRQLMPELATTPIRDPFIQFINEFYNVGGAFDLDLDIMLPYIHSSFFVLIAVVVILQLLMHGTTFGTAVKATGGNYESARLAGISVRLVTVSAYAICGLLTGIAACILVARLTTATEAMGITMELTTIAAAVIGGTSLMGGKGTVLGPVLGTFLLGIILVGLTLMGISQYIQQIITGLILLIAVAYDRFSVNGTTR